jgi:hypothetical protein
LSSVSGDEEENYSDLPEEGSPVSNFLVGSVEGQCIRSDPVVSELQYWHNWHTTIDCWLLPTSQLMNIQLLKLPITKITINLD